MAVVATKDRPKLRSRILVKTMKKKQFIFDSNDIMSGRVPDATLLFDMLREDVVADIGTGRDTMV